MAYDIDLPQLTHGGPLMVNGHEQNFDPVPYLLALLARRFEPLADETVLRSTFDFPNFNRRAGEKTDELLT
eukprot:11193532-Lingulodinium_polyedra.AAC.1